MLVVAPYAAESEVAPSGPLVDEARATNQSDRALVSGLDVGLEAVESARALRPDVVFLDISLPGLDGYQVAARLRGEPELGQTRLVAVTGYGRDEDRRRSREAGFDGHLVKPVDLAEFERVLAGTGADARPGHAPDAAGGPG